MNKLAFLVEKDERRSELREGGDEDCFLCKNDQELFLRAQEKSKLLQCTCCKIFSHALCYRVINVTDSITAAFTCIPCRILQNQPDLTDFQLVLGPFVIDGTKPKQLHDRVSFFLLAEQAKLIQENGFYQLGVFCSKLDMFSGQGKYQYYNWPSDNIVIKLNDNIQSYNVDKICIVEKTNLNFNTPNVFSFDLGDPAAFDNKHVILGITVVKTCNMAFVLEKIIMSQNQTQEDIKQVYKQWTKDMEMEISFSMKDQITQTLIKWPARGRQCTHFTCIDLFTYLEFNLGTQSLQRSRWSCPTCQKRLYAKDIVFDKYLHKFARTNILEKIEPELLCLVEEITCDQNGELRICDESVQKIETARLKKILKTENARIEKEVAVQREVISVNIQKEVAEKLAQPFDLSSFDSSRRDKANQFKDRYPYLNKDNIQDIFKKEKAFLCSLQPLELTLLIMDKYKELKIQIIPSKDEISSCDSLQAVLNFLDVQRSIYQVPFMFIRSYAIGISDENEAKQTACLTLCLILLSKCDKTQNISIEAISYTFIILAIEYSLFEDSCTKEGIQVPKLIGALLYFFTKISNLSMEDSCEFLRQLFYLGGTGINGEHLILSQSEDAHSFLCPLLVSFLTFPFSPPANQLSICKLLFQKQIQKLFPNNIPKLTCVFKLITKIIFAQDESFKNNNFKTTKEFLSLLVDKNSTIINFLKTIAQQIFT